MRPQSSTCTSLSEITATASEASSRNLARYGTHSKYRELRQTGDLLYLAESQFVQLAEDAGLINKNARILLDDGLKLRNRCAIGLATGRVVKRP